MAYLHCRQKNKIVYLIVINQVNLLITRYYKVNLLLLIAIKTWPTHITIDGEAARRAG